MNHRLIPSLALAATLGAVTALACPPVPDRTPGATEIQMEHAWAVMNSEALTNQAPKRPGATEAAGPAGALGTWDPPQDWDVIAIHAALLPTGELLHYAYPSGGGGSAAYTWNPTTGVFTDVELEDDVFCSGISHLTDGTMFVTGGNDYACQFQGRRVTNLFNPFTRTWSSGPTMVDGRWYPTNVTMPDGRVMIFTGLGLDCETNPLVEMYTPGQGLQLVPNAVRGISLYPRMHILSDGRLAHVGSESSAHTYTLDGGWEFVDWNNHGWRGSGTSVLLPGRTDEIMIIGGESNGVVTNTCEIIDFKDANPTFAYAAPLHHARAHLDAVILPDKTVLVMGGGQNGLYDDPIFVPELYDPDTGVWQELPTHVYGRMYHSTTILMPDGRIMVAGQDNGFSALIGEIYNPPYLFRGPRPTITSAPTDIRYGQTFTVGTPDAGAITSAVLTRLGANTHSVHFGQRMVELDIDGAGAASLDLSLTDNPNLAPPGHYMLWILNGDEVPSEARILRIEHPTLGDLDADGDVDFADLLGLLAAWGPCPPDAACPGDLDGDSTVGFGDLLLLLAAWTA